MGRVKPWLIGCVVLGMALSAAIIGLVMVRTAFRTVPENVRTVQAEGYTWEYVFSKPKGKAKGLILAMHGAGGSGPQFDESGQWSKKANAAGFAVVLPTGQAARPNLPANFRTNPHLWNSGQLNSGSPRTKINDFAALEKIVGECQKELGNVPLFVSGHSNGAGMSFAVVSEWSDKVTAMGIMSGNLLHKVEGKAKKPVPTLWIVGEKDPLSPFDGGTTKMEIWGTEKENRPVMEASKQWAEWNGYSGAVRKLDVKDGVTEFRYGDVVRVLECMGHGHAWPGGKKGELPASIIGPDVAKMDATSELVKFYQMFLK
ncbi:MAG: alpha/beta hydrolase family esterase [Fimbriimonadaceae bacterium]